MKNIIKDACILFAITLVAGILLGLVYNVTKDLSHSRTRRLSRRLTRRLLLMLISLKHLMEVMLLIR
mgnify:FL=1